MQQLGLVVPVREQFFGDVSMQADEIGSEC
jgi:hypothetical protein